jgi:hypothetical protein
VIPAVSIPSVAIETGPIPHLRHALHALHSHATGQQPSGTDDCAARQPASPDADNLRHQQTEIGVVCQMQGYQAQTRFMPGATGVIARIWQTQTFCKNTELPLHRPRADPDFIMQVAADKTVACGPGVYACSNAAHRHHVTPQGSTLGSSRAERLRSRAFTSGPLRRSRLLHLPTRG